MNSVVCPDCGGPTVVIGEKPFCQRCGWNLVVAKEFARKTRKGAWLTIGFMFFLWLVAARKMGFDWAWLSSCAAMSLIVALYVLFFSLRARRLFRGSTAPEQSGPSTASRAVPTPADPSPGSIYPSNDTLLPVSKLSIPRSVAVDWRKVWSLVSENLVALAVALGAMAISYFFGKPDHRQNSIAFSVLLAAYLLYKWATIAQHQRKCGSFLRTGIAVRGKVISQELTGFMKNLSVVTYQFQRSDGEEAVGTSRDLAASLYEDMPVIVFYVPDLKDEQAVACETVFKFIQ